MSFLVDNARRLAEVAQTKHSPDSVWTFFIGPEGGIQMVAGADEPLETLRLTRGARAVWRVRREHGSVRVEGRMGKERCLIEMPAEPGAGETAMLANSRMYELRQASREDR